MFSHDGFCPICEDQVTFTAEKAWFRDFLLCSNCKSIPRERALMQVIKTSYPDYKDLLIHESSPANRGVSAKLAIECDQYSLSHYYQDIKPGDKHPRTGVQCQDLEQLTFEDGSFDLFFTQDVMEHVFRPFQVFKEIGRVLKSGGAHIFTVPLVNKAKQSECWASKSINGEIIYYHEPEYHGNPIDAKGSLVTWHYGYDIAMHIMQSANMPTTIVMIDNIDLGIRAEYIEVLISRKF